MTLEVVEVEKGTWERALAAKDRAYSERDMCVAALARLAVVEGCYAWLGRHEGAVWDDDWRNIVFIALPTGQVSWHIHDSELEAFAFLPYRSGPPSPGGTSWQWDAHDTAEKYRRLAAWHAMAPLKEPHVPVVAPPAPGAVPGGGDAPPGTEEVPPG